MSENLPPQLSIKDWLDDATKQLVFADVPSARLDSELILSHTIRKNRTYLHGHPEELLSDRHVEIANARLQLRLDRVPVAYIIGHKEFYGRPFHVTTATLIPRPESESMIEVLRQIVPRNYSLLPDKPYKLVDIGTGSGILGITAKLEYPELDVTLTDNSRHALRVAEENAKALNAKVTTLHGDLLQPYPFTADIILANLPYVDPNWERSPETKHEPPQALFAGNGGLSAILKLIRQAPDRLSSGGFLVLEADPSQHRAIIQAAKKVGLLPHQTHGYTVALQKVR